MQRENHPRFSPSALEFPNVPYRSMTSPSEAAFPSRVQSAPVLGAKGIAGEAESKGVEVANVASTYHVPMLEGDLTNHPEEKERGQDTWDLTSATTNVATALSSIFNFDKTLFGWVCQDVDETLKPFIKRTTRASQSRRDYFEPFAGTTDYGQIGNSRALRDMYSAFKTEVSQMIY